MTAHLTEVLTPDDLECCRWPNNSIKKQSLRSGDIEYRGQRLAYEPRLPVDGKWQVLIDPDRGRVIWLSVPWAKAIWMMR